MTVSPAERDPLDVLQANIGQYGMSQATKIEVARAVAEVQSKVIVAQSLPRDLTRVEQEIRLACSDMGLARVAFYDVKNRGKGPTIHLAKELADIFGHLRYGVRELNRDDAAGQSEVLAFCWDMQRNVESDRTMIIPHQRMAGGKRQAIVDLDDVYRNNQNTGARAMREAIFAVIPRRLTDLAQDLCRQTLERGGGQDLMQRIETMVQAYAKGSVPVQALEAKAGKPRRSWTAQDVADLTITFESLKRREITREEAFPSLVVTSEEILDTRLGATGPAGASTSQPAPQAEPASDPQPAAQAATAEPDSEELPDGPMFPQAARERGRNNPT